MQENESVYMHPVIQEVVQHYTKVNARKCKILIFSLTRELHVGPTDNPLDKKEYIPLAETVLSTLPDTTRTIAPLANNLSLIYKAIGDLDRALELQIKAINIKEKVLKKEHPNLAASYNNLSLIYLAMSDLPKALELQNKAINIREKVLKKSILTW